MATHEPGITGSALNHEILKETSPELAIKVAYDYGRKVARQDMLDIDDAIAEHVDPAFRGTSLYIYIRAGFVAGLGSKALPWRRDIEAADTEGGASPVGAANPGDVDAAHE